MSARHRTTRIDNPAAPPWWRRPLLAGLLLAALTVAVYLPATRCGYIWDDESYVQNNRNLPHVAGLWRIWTAPRSIPQYYPLVHTTYWLEYRLWGLDPAGYHVVNILLHAGAAILLWRVLAMLGVPGAWLGGALYAVHPVCVESVAWITERKNTLSTVLYLGAAMAYLRWALGGGVGAGDGPAGRAIARANAARPAPWRWYALSASLFVLGLLSKTVVCTLPAALLVVVWWKKPRLTWRDVAWPAPLAAVGVAMGLVTLHLERTHVGAEGGEWDLSGVQRVLIAGRALWFYASKLLWPWDLSFVYPRWQVDAGVWWQWVFPLSAGAVLAGLWVARRRIGRGPLAAALIFAGTLAPALGFFNVYPMRYAYVADHFAYLAYPALLALVAAGLTLAIRRLASRRRMAAWAVVAAATVMLSVLTWRQQAGYTDLQTLWRTTLRTNPDAWMAHTNLGNLLLQQGRLDEAIEHHRAAVALRPDDAKGFNNLGGALLVRGDIDEARSLCERALELRAALAEARVNLAKLELAGGSIEQARAQFRQAAEALPDLARNQPLMYAALVADNDAALARWLVSYADARVAQGHLRQAAECYRRAAGVVTDGPEGLSIRLRLASALTRSGASTEALAALEDALRLEPNSAAAMGASAWILATHPDPVVRDPRRATALAARADDLYGHRNPDILDALAAAQAAGGDFASAAATAQEAAGMAQAMGKPQAAQFRARADQYRQRIAFVDATLAGRAD